MPNVESFILQWRETMTASAPRLTPETLEELALHLRETIETLIRSGVPEAEACQRAAAELGSPQSVATEFRKLAPTAWLPVKIITSVGLALAVGLAVLLFRAAPRPGGGLLLGLHVFTVCVGYTAAILLGLLGACFVFQRCRADFSPRRLAPLARVSHRFAVVAIVFTALGIVLGAAWSKREWNQYWGWDAKEIGALCIFVWMAGFLVAHRLRWVTPRGLLLASLAGSNVVALGWFGANLPTYLPVSAHAYSAPTYAAVALFFTVVGNLLVLLVGLAPAGWLRLSRRA